MLEKYNLQMNNECMEQIDLVRNMIKEVVSHDIADISTLSSIQEQIVSFGNRVEKEYGLDDSEFIHSLERIAELLYEISENNSADSKNELLAVTDGLPKLLRASKTVAESRMSLVLIIKDEARYIEEWLEFHNMLGVDHFYVYDNDSSDNLKEVLNTYIDKGMVTYHSWPGNVVQLSAYNHAIEHYKYDTEYMGFIDADEFLFPVEGFSLPDTVDKVFYDYEHHIAKACSAGGIGVNWRSYGTSHHKDIVEGLVIENYKLRGCDDYPQNVHIKVIVKPTLAKEFVYSPHNLIYKGNDCFTISEHGSVIPAAYFYDSHCDLLRINHYYTRSEKELYNKLFVRGWANGSEELQKEYTKSYEARLIECNDIEDDIMDRFIEPLKRRMYEK